MNVSKKWYNEQGNGKTKKKKKEIMSCFTCYEEIGLEMSPKLLLLQSPISLPI